MWYNLITLISQRKKKKKMKCKDGEESMSFLGPRVTVLV